MDYLGLLVEIIFLAGAVYLYGFATGRIRSKDPKLQARADAFLAGNKSLIRILALGLAAIMLVNIVFHLMQLFAA